MKESMSLRILSEGKQSFFVFEINVCVNENVWKLHTSESGANSNLEKRKISAFQQKKRKNRKQQKK